jgi:hypothetical protein
MKTTLLILSFSVCIFVGCSTDRAVTAHSQSAPDTLTNAIPPELVGEWRNSKDSERYAAIYLYADGRGGSLGSDRHTVIGSKVEATYDSKTRVLTLVPLPSRQFTLIYDYDPSSKTLLSRRGEPPFTRRGTKIPRHVQEEIE